jgi:hypothetical protein
MATLNQTGNVKVVNVGLSPNDGTGDDLRTAFVKNNETITTISRFLGTDNVSGPTFATATVLGDFISNTVIANAASLSSTLLVHGNVTATSNMALSGNLTVGGTINGAVTSSVVVTPSLTVGSDTTPGSSTLHGDVFTGNLFVGTTPNPKNLTVTQDVEIHGQLVVHGNVITVTTSEFKVEYPVIEVGKAANVDLSSNDLKDRGIEFYWYDTVANVQQEGFFGFNNLTQKFTYIPRSNYGGLVDSDIFLGSLGTAAFDIVEANVSASGNSIFNTITANTITLTNGINGNLITAVQPNVTTLGTMTGVDVANGNVAVSNGSIYVTGGSMYINGVAVALSTSGFQGGTVPLNTIFSSNFASTATNNGAVVVIGGVGISGNLNVGGALNAPSFAASTLGGTLTTADQPNITSVGTLGNLVVNNNISGNYVGADHIVVSNYINASTITASVGLGGTLTTVAQPNVTSVGTLSSLAVTGAVTAGSFSGPLTGNVTGNVSGTAATVTTAAQPAITSVGTLSGLTVSGATAVGSLNAGAGLIQTTGNVQTTGSLVGTYLYGTLKTPAQPNITSVGSLSSVTVSGASTLVGATTFGAGILAAGAGSQDIGTATNRFGTLYSSALNIAGTITSSAFAGALNGTVGATTPAQGTFTTVTANGLIYSTTGGIKFPDGTIQLTAASGSAVAYATSAGSITNQANSATIAASTTLPSTIVLRDGSGNFNAGTITATTFNGAIVGSGASLTTGTVPTSALVSGSVTIGTTAIALGSSNTSLAGLSSVTATNFYGTLNGTATSASSATSAGSITGQANSATTTAVSTNTANQIVLRDGSGNFSAGTITASFSGALTGSLSGTATNANTVGGYTPSVSPGVASRVVVADAGGYINNTFFNSTDSSATTGVTAIMVKTGDNYLRSGTAAAVSAFLGLTSTSSLTATTGNAANTLVLRDSLGNFTAGTITALQYSGAGSGLTGIAGSLTANTIVNQANSATITSTSANTASTIVARDASGNFSAGVITATLTGSATSASTAGSITGQANSATTTATAANTAGQIVLRDPTTSGFSAGPIVSSGTINADSNILVGQTAASVNATRFIKVNNQDAGISAGSSAWISALGASIQMQAIGTGSTALSGYSAGKGILYSTSTNGMIIWDNSSSSQIQFNLGASTTPVATLTAGGITLAAGGVFTGTSTSARYADLAEKYQADGEYGPGTVVVFGGSKEITVTGHRADVSVAGVISTAPAYLMNVDEPNSVAVALRGKVPCKVIGPVNKGDLLVTSYVAGFAESVGKDGSFGVAVFAKSLDEDLGVGPKIINVVII